jgi:sugar-specific transcriptional regulator TrmB
LRKNISISRTEFYRVLDEMIKKGLIKVIGKENRLSLLYKAL